VLDLRNSAEISRQANPFDGMPGILYVNVSLFSALAPVEMMAAEQPGFDMGERYCAGLDGCQNAIAEVLMTIADAPKGSVLFHCSAGKDRTGIIAALLLANAGVGEATIVDDYALTGSISGPLIADLRDQAVLRGVPAAIVDIVLAAEPDSMRHALHHLRMRYGGVDGYLTTIGLQQETISRLRDRLLAEA
jgi:protein-tyrosine phosphatase